MVAPPFGSDQLVTASDLKRKTTGAPAGKWHHKHQTEFPGSNRLDQHCVNLLEKGLIVSDVHLNVKVLLSGFKVRSNRRRKTAVTFGPWKQELCTVLYLNANWK